MKVYTTINERNGFRKALEFAATASPLSDWEYTRPGSGLGELGVYEDIFMIENCKNGFFSRKGIDSLYLGGPRDLYEG